MQINVVELTENAETLNAECCKVSRRVPQRGALITSKVEIP